VDDSELEERVRAQLGHAVSHPGSLEVIVRDGAVTVLGQVLRGEYDRIRKRLEQTRGVRDLDMQVEVYDSPGDIPGLQGESRWQRKQRVGE
jgi:osmotically-inducible protein OsmY